MIVDEIGALARKVGICAEQPREIGYRFSRAAWLLSLIEDKLQVASHGTLYERLAALEAYAMELAS